MTAREGNGIYMSGFKRLHFPHRHELIQEQIKQYILENGLEPGSKLPSEIEIAERIGVSRSVVREAMRSLEAVGVIETLHGSGRYLKGFDFENIAHNLAYSLVLDKVSLIDLLEVRRVIECSFLGQAVDSLDENDLRELRLILEQMHRRAENGEPFAEEDMNFHRKIFAKLSNRVAIRLLDVFWSLFLTTLSKEMLFSENPLRTVEFHQSLLSAIEKRDKGLAEAMIGTHFDEVHQRLAKKPATPLAYLGEEVRADDR